MNSVIAKRLKVHLQPVFLTEIILSDPLQECTAHHLPQLVHAFLTYLHP